MANHARLAADIINYLIITAICDECKKREWAANEPHHRIVGPKQQKPTPKSDSSSISSQIICNFCLFKNYIRPIFVWVICTERETEGEHKPHTRKIFLYYLFPAPRLSARIRSRTYIILFRSLTGFIAAGKNTYMMRESNFERDIQRVAVQHLESASLFLRERVSADESWVTRSLFGYLICARKIYNEANCGGCAARKAILSLRVQTTQTKTDIFFYPLVLSADSCAARWANM